MCENMNLAELVCAFTGFASDCRAKEHLSADPPSSPEWKQQSPKSNAPWVRDHYALFQAKFSKHFNM